MWTDLYVMSEMECWLSKIKHQEAQEFCSPPGQVELSNLLATPEYNKESEIAHKNKPQLAFQPHFCFLSTMLPTLQKFH